METRDVIRAGMENAASKALSIWFAAARDSVKTVRFASYTTHKMVEASLAPALDAAVAIQEQVASSILAALTGKRELPAVIHEARDRMMSGARYARLVGTLGKELFGTARFAGEEVLAEDGAYRLSFLPPKDGANRLPLALFHAAGGVPYGDRLFRLLPEANLFNPILARGMPVYLMELRGDRHEADHSQTTVDRLANTLERFTTVAFEHNGRRKMALEGYCGHGLQAWAYVCSRPEDADRKFNTVVNWVAPIDGRECTLVSELSAVSPSWLTGLSVSAIASLYGAMPGGGYQVGLDMGLKNLFPKTPFGRFSAGWNQPGYAGVTTAADLNPEQRLELAGAYWISPEGADRWPLPVDLVRYASAVFARGIAPNGDIPWSVDGQPISFKDAAKRTKFKVVGIYGGRDLVVPDRTAFVLRGVFGDRYTHVVHPAAGHVSYVFAPKQWDRSHPARFDPHPVDAILGRPRRTRS